MTASRKCTLVIVRLWCNIDIFGSKAPSKTDQVSHNLNTKLYLSMCVYNSGI